MPADSALPDGVAGALNDDALARAVELDHLQRVRRGWKVFLDKRDTFVRFGAKTSSKGSSRLGVITRAAVYYHRHFSILDVHQLNDALVGLEGLHDDLCGEVALVQLHFGRLRLITGNGFVFSISAEHVIDPF